MSSAHARRLESLAPWAEIVPNAPPHMTVEDLLAWPDDGYRFELVEGVLVRMAGSGAEATTIAGIIHGELYSYVRPRRLGIVTPADGVYKFPGTETGLLPDVGFYIAERRVLITDGRKPLPFAPDLAVEVASPDQRSEDLAAKALMYLGGGTRLVWVVWPAQQRIDVWQSGVLSGPARTLGTGDVLAGLDIVPGFSLSVAQVFADPLD